MTPESNRYESDNNVIHPQHINATLSFPGGKDGASVATRAAELRCPLVMAGGFAVL